MLLTYIPKHMVPLATPPPFPRVLLVDDEELVARAFARVLRHDADVTVEVDSTLALARIARGDRFELVISDVMMRGMNGLELFERVLECAPAIRFIFMSGGMDGALELRILATGQPLLQKPIAPADLLQLLRQLAPRRG